MPTKRETGLVASVVYGNYDTIQEVGGKKYKYINKSFNLDAILETLSPFDYLTSGTKALRVLR